MRHRCQSKMNNNGRMNGLPGFYFLLQPSKTFVGKRRFYRVFLSFFLPSFQGARRYCVTAAIKTKSNEWATGFILSPPLTGLFFGEMIVTKFFFYILPSF